MVQVLHQYSYPWESTYVLPNKVVLEPRVSPENTSKYVDTVTVFAKTWTKGHWPLDDLWPHICWGPHVWLYPRIVSKSHENTSKYVDTVTFSANKFNQRSLTPRWPLTPHLLRSHVWLYSMIIVSKSHGNTSMYGMWMDTVINFANYQPKNHWPLDDLWPHICWGLMCDSTQGSLCPSPMKIHQSMLIQLPFFAKNLNQRSLTPRWPLTPYLLRSHVWLYQRIIVSKSHENTSMYVDTVINFCKLPYKHCTHSYTYYVQN